MREMLNADMGALRKATKTLGKLVQKHCKPHPVHGIANLVLVEIVLRAVEQAVAVLLDRIFHGLANDTDRGHSCLARAGERPQPEHRHLRAGVQTHRGYCRGHP
jgi:hypothetical protein